MAIIETVGRIGGTMLAMVETRLELAALEVEEESQRLLGYFALALLSLILLGIALVLVSLTIILVFWDTYRLQAALALAALFAVAGTMVGLKLRTAFRTRPRMLAATVAELNKDVNFFRNAGHKHEA
ncbi:phage holin family protein [Massilia sp. TSP1-1-2]|uniref:phage holin family protein n=1 Tax=unclassified Massilia TaxID=2609279 RepID=UPI003CF82233